MKPFFARSCTQKTYTIGNPLSTHKVYTIFFLLIHVLKPLCSSFSYQILGRDPTTVFNCHEENSKKRDVEKLSKVRWLMAIRHSSHGEDFPSKWNNSLIILDPFLKWLGCCALEQMHFFPQKIVHNAALGGEFISNSPSPLKNHLSCRQNHYPSKCLAKFNF